MIYLIYHHLQQLTNHRHTRNWIIYEVKWKKKSFFSFSSPVSWIGLLSLLLPFGVSLKIEAFGFFFCRNRNPFGQGRGRDQSWRRNEYPQTWSFQILVSKISNYNKALKNKKDSEFSWVSLNNGKTQKSQRSFRLSQSFSNLLCYCIKP